MAGIDELSRVIGGLEESIKTLFIKQDIFAIRRTKKKKRNNNEL
jgi:hypothetical protein